MDRESCRDRMRLLRCLSLQGLQHREGHMGRPARRILHGLKPEERYHADRRQFVHVSAETPELPNELVLSRRQPEGG